MSEERRVYSVEGVARRSVHGVSVHSEEWDQYAYFPSLLHPIPSGTPVRVTVETGPTALEILDAEIEQHVKGTDGCATGYSEGRLAALRWARRVVAGEEG